VLVPLVLIAPLNRTIPEITRTDALAAPAASFQPWPSFSAVNDLPDSENVAPSSEVLHWNIQAAGASTFTTPVGAMSRSPMPPVQTLITTLTVLRGRNLRGSVNALREVPAVLMSPAKCTMPPVMPTEGLR
jgi:hypothetical protein